MHEGGHFRIIAGRYWWKKNSLRKGRKRPWFLISPISLSGRPSFPPREILHSRTRSTKKNTLERAIRERAYTHPSFWVGFPEYCLSCLLSPHGSTFLFIKASNKNLPLHISEPATLLSGSSFQNFYHTSPSLLHADFARSSAFVSWHRIIGAAGRHAALGMLMCCILHICHPTCGKCSLPGRSSMQVLYPPWLGSYRRQLRQRCST